MGIPDTLCRCARTAAPGRHPPSRLRPGFPLRLALIAALGLAPALHAEPPRAAAPDPRVEEALESLPPARRRTLRWQLALESWGFSPGVIDGRMGPKTRMALAAAQTCRGAPATGEPEADTLKALGGEKAPLLQIARVTRSDLEQIDDSPPLTWVEKSERERLDYHSLPDLLAEKYHTSPGFLEELNPATSLHALRAGDTLVVPALRSFRHRTNPGISHVEIDLARKVILLVQEQGGQRYLKGLLHCSIAADPSEAPVGVSTVRRIVSNPNYTFNPDKWPEVHDVPHTLVIPPGPRNPVGLCWIALSRPGYGIHGTPSPTAIGKTGSHGCFRLTNWDVTWLSQVLEVGVEVRVFERSDQTSWNWKSPVSS